MMNLNGVEIKMQNSPRLRKQTTIVSGSQTLTGQLRAIRLFSVSVCA
jgi:hypothetical protein